MGAGRKRNPTAAAVARARPRGAEANPERAEHGNGETLLDDLEHTRLLTDERAWVVAGDELRRRDPTRYVQILRVVEEICQIYRDPLAPVGPAYRVVSRGNGDDFD